MATKGPRVHAAFNVKDEKKMRELVGPLIEASRKEPGCLHFELFELAIQAEGRKKFAFIEHWASKEALEAHTKAKHTQEFMAAAKAANEEPALIGVYKPVQF